MSYMESSPAGYRTTYSPLYLRPMVWVLLLPMLYFAGHGSFFFENAAGNNSLSATYTSLTNVQTAEEARGQVLELVSVSGIVLLMASAKRRTIVAAMRQNRMFLFLTMLAVGSVVWSQFPTTTIRYSLYLIVNVVFAYLVIASFRPEERLELVAFVGGVAFVLSVFVALFMPQYGVDQREGVSAWQGIFPQKNSCAIMVTMFVSVVPFMERNGGIAKLLRMFYLALGLFLIIMSQSRTGWLLAASLFLFVAIYQISLKFEIRTRAIVLILFSVVALGVGIFLYSHLAIILISLGKDPTLTGRTQIWSAVLDSISKRPLLGYGYRAFWGRGMSGEASSIAASTGWVVSHAQSGFLDVWLDLGIVGLGILLFTFVQAFQNAAICLRYRPRRYVGWYLSVVILSLLCNLGERTLLYPNFLEWILYIVACVGLSEEARRVQIERLNEPVL